jgi:small subunit ribosomal protein S7
MPRKQILADYKRKTPPDARFNNTTVEKFIRRMMIEGKKSVSRRVLYDAMDVIADKTQKDPLEVFLKALENVRPAVEVKSRRVGGSTYQVPVEIRESRADALAMRWIIQYARGRSGSAMSARLSQELMDAFNNTGSAFKKKEDTHRMAEANKAFAHYKW